MDIVQCIDCKFWNHPSTYMEDIKDWSKYLSECRLLPKKNHVEIDLFGPGDMHPEIYTVGSFGCILGEKMEGELGID